MNSKFIITLINEPHKRPGWANGFSQRFKMPRAQNYRTIKALSDHIKKINARSQFIVVDHYTNQSRTAKCRIIDASMFTILFSGGGNSTGVYYCDPIDDFCYKLIMSGLY